MQRNGVAYVFSFGFNSFPPSIAIPEYSSFEDVVSQIRQTRFPFQRLQWSFPGNQTPDILDLHGLDPAWVRVVSVRHSS